MKSVVVKLTCIEEIIRFWKEAGVILVPSHDIRRFRYIRLQDVVRKGTRLDCDAEVTVILLRPVETPTGIRHWFDVFFYRDTFDATQIKIKKSTLAVDVNNPEIGLSWLIPKH